MIALRCTIEDNTHIAELIVAIEVVNIRELTTVKQTLADNIYTKVSNTACNKGISNNQCRNAIDNYLVVQLATLGNKLIEAI